MVSRGERPLAPTENFPRFSILLKLELNTHVPYT